MLARAVGARDTRTQVMFRVAGPLVLVVVGVALVMFALVYWLGELAARGADRVFVGDGCTVLNSTIHTGRYKSTVLFAMYYRTQTHTYENARMAIECVEPRCTALTKSFRDYWHLRVCYADAGDPLVLYPESTEEIPVNIAGLLVCSVLAICAGLALAVRESCRAGTRLARLSDKAGDP